MTDTTDKLSLQQLKDVRELCLPHTAWRLIIDELISARDRLEAERQRADAVCRDIRIQANDLKSAQTVNKVLQAEIAALKGERVPVAWRITPTAGRGSYVETNPVFIEKLGELAFRVEPLFTAPQNPVVLPAEFYSAVQNNDGMFELSENCMCAISSATEAAGGIVKDGE